MDPWLLEGTEVDWKSAAARMETRKSFRPCRLSKSRSAQSGLPNVTFMALAHPQKDSNRKAFDGLLSTDLFRRVFINHVDNYAVLEP